MRDWHSSPGTPITTPMMWTGSDLEFKATVGKACETPAAWDSIMSWMATWMMASSCMLKHKGLLCLFLTKNQGICSSERDFWKPDIWNLQKNFNFFFLGYYFFLLLKTKSRLFERLFSEGGNSAIHSKVLKLHIKFCCGLSENQSIWIL